MRLAIMFHKRSPMRCAARLQVEQLEGREVPATIFAVNAAGRLLTFDSSNPGTLESGVTITGLVTPGEHITDIDVRPGTDGLYGRSNLGRLYLINPLSGFATPVGDVVTTNAPNVGIDFDPLTNQLNVVSNLGENLSLNPTDGSVASMGTQLSYLPGDAAQGQPPRITGLAFTNSVPLAASSTLFGIDQLRNTLVEFVGSPSNGQLLTIGSLGFDVKAGIGFDIDPASNIAYATLQLPGFAFSEFATINLSTGAATLLGPVGPDRLIDDIAVDVGGVSASNMNFAGTPQTQQQVLSPGISTPFFTITPIATPVGVPTATLFPSLVQPLQAGLFAPPFTTTPTTIDTTQELSLEAQDMSLDQAGGITIF
jgi:Domain of unknown function (DUF4394)